MTVDDGSSFRLSLLIMNDFINYQDVINNDVIMLSLSSDRDQCQPNPCLYGGNCTNSLGGFLCSCPDRRHGNMCELQASDAERPPAAAQEEETGRAEPQVRPPPRASGH